MAYGLPQVTPGPARVTTILGKLLEMAAQRLRLPADLRVLAPGQQVAYDDPCGGQLWVRIVSIAPWINQNSTSPKPNIGCWVNGWTINAAVGVIRCVSIIDDNGNIPTDDELLADFDRIAVDMEDLSVALLQDFAVIPQIERFMLGNWTPSGPNAAVAGGEWTFQFNLPYCPRVD